MRIGKDNVVLFHYELRSSDGDVIDTSQGQEPLSYHHGRGEIIDGLERALEGHGAGDEFDIDIPPEEAYGPFLPHLELAVPPEVFPEAQRDSLGPGYRFIAEDPHTPGEERVFTVTGVERDRVMISGNHPLAGETLHFHILVVDVQRDAEERG